MKEHQRIVKTVCRPGEIGAEEIREHRQQLGRVDPEGEEYAEEMLRRWDGAQRQEEER